MNMSISTGYLRYHLLSMKVWIVTRYLRCGFKFTTSIKGEGVEISVHRGGRPSNFCYQRCWGWESKLCFKKGLAEVYVLFIELVLQYIKSHSKLCRTKYAHGGLNATIWLNYIQLRNITIYHIFGRLHSFIFLENVQPGCKFSNKFRCIISVSYTHLTLPTILLV